MSNGISGNSCCHCRCEQRLRREHCASPCQAGRNRDFGSAAQGPARCDCEGHWSKRRQGASTGRGRDEAADVEGLVKKAVDTFGKIDVLVSNAGIMPIAPLALLKVDEWDRMIDLNIKGVLYGVAAALPQMRKQQSGHFINVASVFGIKVFAPGGTIYCATKAAVRTLTEGLRMEVHSDNIRTTIIDPGAVASELKESTSDQDSSKAVKQLYEAWSIPAESIARAVAYAIEQPADVDINEIVVRPVMQDF